MEAFFPLFTSQLTSYFIFQKFARQQSIFPDFSKPGLERVFLPVTSPNKHLEPVTLHKTEVVWAGFLQVVFPKGLSGVPMCHTGQEKNVPHTQGGVFLWSPASDWKHLKMDPTPLFVNRTLKTIPWPHSMGPPAGCSPVLLLHHYFLSVLFSYLVNIIEIFQSYESYGVMPLEKSLGKYESPELALWQTLEDSCPLPHLRNISSNVLCFLVLAQMFYVWEKLTGQAVRQWEIFSK